VDLLSAETRFLSDATIASASQSPTVIPRLCAAFTAMSRTFAGTPRIVQRASPASDELGTPLAFDGRPPLAPLAFALAFVCRFVCRAFLSAMIPSPLRWCLTAPSAALADTTKGTLYELLRGLPQLGFRRTMPFLHPRSQNLGYFAFRRNPSSTTVHGAYGGFRRRRIKRARAAVSKTAGQAVRAPVCHAGGRGIFTVSAREFFMHGVEEEARRVLMSGFRMASKVINQNIPQLSVGCFWGNTKRNF